MPKVNPEILVWARETARFELDEAARKLGFRDTLKRRAKDRLNALEMGEDEPSRSVLVRMAQQYRRPLLTFYLSKPPAKGERGVDFRTLPAEHSGADETLLDALVRDVRARQSMVRAVLEDMEEDEPLEFVGSRRTEDGAAAALSSLQALVDVDLVAYRRQRDAATAFGLLRASVERAGIFVLIKGDIGNYLTAIDTSVFRGFSISDEVAPFIVINDQDARPAWSFTLLHETVHLLLGQTGVGNARADSEVERFCDDVAGEFLLPMEELDQLVLDQSGDIGAISERISMFASQRNLSRAMVAYKAFRRNLISQVTYAQLSATYRQQWRADREHTRAQAREQEGGPSFYIVRRYRLGNRIADLVQRTMRADVLSTSKAARILGVKSTQVQPLLDSGRLENNYALPS